MRYFTDIKENKLEIILSAILIISLIANLKLLSSLQINENQIQILEEKMQRLFSKKQSKAVKRGQNVEQITPFFEKFPHYGKKIVPCFQPIDYIVFDKDEIVFVELKTGSAGLSKSQQNIKKIVNEGKVRFEQVRVDDKGFKVK